MQAQAAPLKREIEAKLANRIPAALSPVAQQASRLHPLGNVRLDNLLGGGLPLGSVCELTGPDGSGHNSIALSLLASASTEGACAYRETEAEAIAFVVSQTIGLDAGKSSADYIHLYHGNAALLAESLEVIQKTSALILSAIETEQVSANQTEDETATQEEQSTNKATDAALAEGA